METLHADCCIAGGGPAGMMLGLLLARAGVDVIVLEKHADFLRDFRGDTIHPSTLQAIDDLGWLNELLQRPHHKAYHIGGHIGDRDITVADFSHLPVPAPYVAFMPQWDFLDFLAKKASVYPSFRLLMNAEVRDLRTSGQRVIGLTAKTPQGELSVESTLVVGADGRGSRVREASGLKVIDSGAPIDVLWFRLPRTEDDTAETLGRFVPGNILIMINRGDYWQCGYVIPKGRFEKLKADGFPAFVERISTTVPFLRQRLLDLGGWEPIKLLTVKVDHLEKWHRDGLLCIGDAAHAMSPVGGVGINFAVQDAIATARLLATPLKAKTLTESDLARVERRRAWPARFTQRFQIFVHEKIIYGVLQSEKPFTAPLPLQLLARFPILQRLPGRFIGMGLRPERVEPLP